jgi:hypothetical protein
MGIRKKFINQIKGLMEKNSAVDFYIKKKYDNDLAMVSVKEIIGIVIVCLVIAYVLPTGLVALGAINTTGMSAGEIALLGAFGIIIVIIIFAKLTE